MSDSWVQILLALLGTGVVTTVITALMNRKKLAIDSDSVFVGTANDIVQMVRDQMNADQDRFSRRLADIQSELLETQAALRRSARRQDELERRERSYAEVLTMHAAWDHIAVQTIRAGGRRIDDPPPLLPGFYRHQGPIPQFPEPPPLVPDEGEQDAIEPPDHDSI